MDDCPPDSPSSATTVPNAIASRSTMPPSDDQYKTMHPRPRHHLRRRSSHLQRWIEDQQNIPSGVSSPVVDFSLSPPVSSAGTACNPYLAYPHLNAAHRNTMNDVDTLHSYDVVEDDDFPEERTEDPILHEHLLPTEPPSPTHSRSQSPGSRQSSRLLQPPPSLRNFHFSFRPASPTFSHSAASTGSRSPSRLSLFQRPVRPVTSAPSSKHIRASSFSTLDSLNSGALTESPASPSGSMSWRWRPSVLGHFSSTSVSQDSTPDTQPSPSRPSISSTNTYSSTTTPSTVFYTEGKLPATSHKLSFMNSFRPRTKSTNASALFQSSAGSTSSSPSLFSASAIPHLSDPEGRVKRLAHKASTIRLPFAPKAQRHANADEAESEAVPRGSMLPHVVYTSTSNGGTLPRVSLSSLGSTSRSKHKKKLVISGIAVDDTRRFDAAKRWCESFGEVSQIMRMPNGDLHVSFRKGEVADTVCRLRAKVYIPNVGSVYLSWYTGSKRT